MGIDLKPGHIINEYSMATPHPVFGPKRFGSYLVIEDSESRYHSRGRKPSYKCLCLYNGMESPLKIKPGDFTTLVKEWITDRPTAINKCWPTFWEVT